MYILFAFSTLLILANARGERNSEQTFDNVDVIELPMGRFPDPDCGYTVHRDRRDGPKPFNEQVHVGDPLYHKWKCSYGGHDSSLYCLMVNNCTVSSERNSRMKVPILDEFGCSLFPSILPHVHYTGDMEGGLQVHAFSLDIDKAAVFFECNIKLLLKLNGVCRRPTCQPLERFQEKSAHRSRFRLV